MFNFKRLSSGLVLTLIAATLSPLPAAQAAPYRTTCETTIALSQGASLSYRVTGTLPAAPTTASPQNPIGTSLTLTIQKRDRNGRMQTLLNATTLREYEQIAPDADYSRLPFTGQFRGQPNNGQRLYAATASVNGLYLSLRPTNGAPQQLQVVHYLSRDQFVRSNAGTCRPT
ncbi:MAG: hypothetical protein HC800_24630 [Phormidesmis sp. RL_2_1]|nr:hypothetical protein [Phormidesmis sp. RL_2_1]